MKFLERLIAVLVAGLMSLSAYATIDGVWSETPAGLPYCRYSDANKDSAFRLGNYRMNVVTHSNGTYQIVSGERVWAEFNADRVMPGTGRNRAALGMGRQTFELVGPKSNIAGEVYTGIGFTRYEYKLKGGIKCSRMISVMPSDSVNVGNPCFLITVTLSNTGRSAKTVSYVESFMPEYLPIADRMIPLADRAVNYTLSSEISFRCLKAHFIPERRTFIQGTPSKARSRHDFFPQSVFLYAKDAFLIVADGEFQAEFSDIKLKSGEKKVIQVVIGLTNDGEDAKTLAEELVGKSKYGQFGAFEQLWKKRLPDFYDKNRSRKRELYMNAHALEASAVYDAYFDETFIPCESGDAFRTGRNLSNKDHLQCALPTCYTNPELTKSVMRYVMKHADYDGRIYDGNLGYGYIPHSYIKSYDTQIYLFHLLSEYLRITGDYSFLDESLNIFNDESVTVMELIERCFVFLRDELILEDDVAIRHTQGLVSAYFPRFISQMKESERTSALFIESIEQYYIRMWNSYRASEHHINEDDNQNLKSLNLYEYFKGME